MKYAIAPALAALALVALAPAATAFSPGAHVPASSPMGSSSAGGWGVGGAHLVAPKPMSEATRSGSAAATRVGVSRVTKKERTPSAAFVTVMKAEASADSASSSSSSTSEDDTASSSSEEEPKKFIISGAPASGKGTQCERIKEKYGVVHLSTGDMLRKAVADGTDVGKAAQSFMDAGELVPDDIIIGVVKDRLLQSDCQTQGWLLDGFPRTPGQALALSSASIVPDCFIILNVPDSELVERVTGRRTDPETGKIYHTKFSPPEDEEVAARLVQRSDDTEEAIKVRLEAFHSYENAVKGNYVDISVEVDGSGSPKEVGVAVEEAIVSMIGA